MSGNGDLAIRDTRWKYIPDVDVADGWYGGKKKAGAKARPGLYDLTTDPGETTNLSSEKPEIVKELQARLEKSKTTAQSRPGWKAEMRYPR